MKVLVLAAGAPASGNEYPLCLTEFNGEPLIQKVLNACAALKPSHVIVAVPEADVRRYHLDNIVTLITPNSTVLSIRGETRGAACTALLAAGEIDNDEDLLIVNGNEWLDADFSPIVADFRKRKLDGGVVVFQSVHPRYSYVKVNGEGYVVEAAEKRPISQNATAGFYWYARGADLIAACKDMIRKDAQVNGNFYICPAFNEMVLAQKTIGIHKVEAKQYHPLKSERQIEKLEAAMERLA